MIQIIGVKVFKKFHPTNEKMKNGWNGLNVPHSHFLQDNIVENKGIPMKYFCILVTNNKSLYKQYIIAHLNSHVGMLPCLMTTHLMRRLVVISSHVDTLSIFKNRIIWCSEAVIGDNGIGYLKMGWPFSKWYI